MFDRVLDTAIISLQNQLKMRRKEEATLFLNDVLGENGSKMITDKVNLLPGLILIRYLSRQHVFGVISSRTQTNADVFVLKKKHLDVVLSHYPQIRKQIIETAEERQRLVRERAEAAARKKKEEEERKKQEELERQKNLKELDSADGESTKKEGTVSDSKNGNEGGSSNQEVSQGFFLKGLIFTS